MSKRLQCGPFRLEERIGRGAAGDVWRATHSHSDADVAVKLFDHTGGRALVALRNEVRAAARLDHPGIVMLFEQGAATIPGLGESPYLAMEFCSGGALSTLKTRLRWSELREQLIAILEALAHAHSRGVIHRDLKPSNVLLAPSVDACDYGQLRPKLADFGISRALAGAREDASSDPSQGRLSGTLPYMAPEQLAGHWRDEGPWTDLYSLGVIAYESTSGQLPWRTRGREELLSSMVQAVPPLRARIPVPDEFQGWLDKLLAPLSNARFQTAAAALDGLHSLGSPAVWGAAAPGHPVAVRKHTSLPESPPARALDLQGIGLSLYGLRPTRLVGRPSLRKAAWDTVKRATAGNGPRVLVIRGPMGVGTSKFAGWLAENAHADHGALKLHASHSPIAGPPDGLPAMARRHLQANGLDGLEQARRVASLLADVPLPDDSPLEASSLLALLAQPESNGRHTVVLGEQHRTIERYLRRLAGRQPVILTIDNAQWGHNALSLCRSILDAEISSPLMILCLIDDGALLPESQEAHALERLSEHEHTHVEQLGALSPNEQRELISSTLGLAPACLDVVVERTQGDALFATSLLRYWVQARLLMPSEDGFVLRPEAQASTPATLIEVWEAQLDCISEELAETTSEQLKESLEIATALGVSVHTAEWHAASRCAGLEVPAGLVDGLAELNLVTTGQHGWHFRHASFRDHLRLRAREHSRWERHHGHCADALEELGARAKNSHKPQILGRIGQHLVEAGRHAQACYPLLTGAVDARDVSDWRESHRFFDLLDHATAVAGDDHLATEALIERIPCLLGEGKVAQAEVRAQRAFERAASLQSTELRGRARLAIAAIEFDKGGPDKAETHLERALEDFAENVSAWRIRALSRLGTICMWKRELPRAASLFAQAQALLDESPAYHSERGQTMRGMAHLAHCNEDYSTATQLMEAARACFAAEGNRFATASCINDLGDLSRHQGKTLDSEKLYRQALDIYRSLEAANASTVQCNLGFLLLERGRFGEAEPLFEQLHRASLTEERQIDVLWILWGRLTCAAAAKRWDEWEPLQTRIDELSERGLVDEDLASASRLAAGHARRSGRYEHASWAYRYALGHYERMGKPAKARRVRELLADLGVALP